MRSCHLTRIYSVQMEPAMANVHWATDSTSSLVEPVSWGQAGAAALKKWKLCHSCCDFCGCKLDRVKGRRGRKTRKARQGGEIREGQANLLCGRSQAMTHSRNPDKHPSRPIV